MERIELHEIPGFSFGQVQDVAAGTGLSRHPMSPGSRHRAWTSGAGSPGTRTPLRCPLSTGLWSTPWTSPGQRLCLEAAGA